MFSSTVSSGDSKVNSDGLMNKEHRRVESKTGTL